MEDFASVPAAKAAGRDMSPAGLKDLSPLGPLMKRCDMHREYEYEYHFIEYEYD